MKPINTQYKGYLFRSRLEARWAVFFDALGIEWEYEPEGYELQDGTRYLPDFLLKTREPCWIEIKGQIRSSEDITKLQNLCEQTQMRGFLICRTPGDEVVHMMHPTEESLRWRLSLLASLKGFVCYVAPRKTKEEAICNAVTAARSARFEFADAEQRLAYMPITTRGAYGSYS